MFSILNISRTGLPAQHVWDETLNDYPQPHNSINYTFTPNVNKFFAFPVNGGSEKMSLCCFYKQQRTLYARSLRLFHTHMYERIHIRLRIKTFPEKNIIKIQQVNNI